jgi:hypothetical protein
MVGIVIGEVAFEQMELCIEGIGEVESLGQQQAGPQTAEAATANFVGDIVVDVPVGEHATTLLLPTPLPQPILDPPLAIAQPFLYCGIHLKSFPHFADLTGFPSCHSP